MIMTDIQAIIEHATRKFGNVKAINQYGEQFVLMIECGCPAVPAAPFMTIRAHGATEHNKDISYAFGSYVLTADRALTDFQSRCDRLKKLGGVNHGTKP